MTFSYIWIMIFFNHIYSLSSILSSYPLPGKPFYLGNGSGSSQKVLKGHYKTTEVNFMNKLDPLSMLSRQRGSCANRY